VDVRLAYIGVRENALKGAGRLVWYPFARLDPADEEGWCLLIDCFAAALAGSSTARLLLSRRLEVSRLELHPQPPIDAPRLEPVSCGQEVLQEIKTLRSRPGGASVTFSPFEPVDYAAVRMLGSRLALRRIEEFFKGFVKPHEMVEALLEAVKPERLTYWGVLYVLLQIDEKRRAFFIFGGRRVRSTLHEAYLMREDVWRNISRG